MKYINDDESISDNNYCPKCVLEYYEWFIMRQKFMDFQKSGAINTKIMLCYYTFLSICLCDKIIHRKFQNE